MRKFNLITILLFAMLLCGCTGKVELDDLAYVVAIGADVAESGEKNDIDITYQVAIPLKISGKESETGKKTFSTYTVTAPSLDVGNSIVNTMTSKEIDLSHTELILYSEELARDELAGHVSSLISNLDIRPRTVVSVCKGKAKDLLEKVSPVLESSPAKYYELILTSFNYTSQSAGTEILNFYTSTQTPYKNPIAILSEIAEKGNVKFSGLAVFRGTKMVGELDPNLTLGHLILSDDLKETSIFIDDIKEPSKTATVKIKQFKKSKVKVNIIDNIPHIEITTYIDSYLQSTGADTDYLVQENKNKLNKAVAEKVTSVIENYLKKTIELNSDIAGIGRYAKKNCLTWQEFEKINWPKIYKNSKYSVKTEVNLNVSQIISHSLPTIK